MPTTTTTNVDERGRDNLTERELAILAVIREAVHAVSLPQTLANHHIPSETAQHQAREDAQRLLTAVDTLGWAWIDLEPADGSETH